jgi:hypothetical protein
MRIGRWWSEEANEVKKERSGGKTRPELATAGIAAEQLAEKLRSSGAEGFQPPRNSFLLSGLQPLKSRQNTFSTTSEAGL